MKFIIFALVLFRFADSNLQARGAAIATDRKLSDFARLVGKSVEPDLGETERNPRARSARLRVAERLGQGIAA